MANRVSSSETESRTESGIWKYLVERRADGAILVRVPSTGQFGEPLPDAVFAFKSGEPQFRRWEREAANFTARG